MDVRTKERGLRLTALALLFVLAGYQVVVSLQYWDQLRWPENVIDPGYSVVAPWPSVGRVSGAAERAGLRNGEKILEVQGQRYAGERARLQLLDKMFPGDRARLTVQGADGTRREVSWQFEAADGGRMTVGRMAFLALMTTGMPFLSLFLGFWAVFARPGDRQAWLLLGMLASFSHSVVNPPYFSGLPLAAAVFFREMHPLLRGSWGLFMFLFAWEFPRRTAWQERAHRYAQAVVIFLCACAGLVAATSVATGWGEPAQWSTWIDRLLALQPTMQLIQMAAVSCFFGLLTYKRVALPDPESRRRVRAILFGAVLALTPLFLLVVVAIVRGHAPQQWGDWLIIPALLAMCLFPVTLAYVIVVHRAFGLRVVIRQGLRYAFARRGVMLLQILMSVGVFLVAVWRAGQPGMNRPRIIFVVTVGTLLVLLLQSAADRLREWVDRLFFREAYNAEQLLESLTDDLRTMVETKPLLETMATRIAEALHVDRIAMLVREDGNYRPAYAVGYMDSHRLEMPAAAMTAEILKRGRTPLRVYLDDRSSWIYREGVSEEELAWLRRAGVELLLPLATKDKLLGIVGLGRKRSEEPYTGSDVRLLNSVAAQAGLALENSQLAAAITEAVAQRERLNREVEIAQEVQERLFPQNMPEIPGVDYWGYCRPARGIGGDSYDFLRLEDGTFALSIGDVSGKGIPAALLMASLQSALRGQAMSAPADLGAMMGRLNRLIFDSSPENRYATLFYGQYNPASRMMTYVNGGHNPPMIMRGKEILRLEDGGPVVGLFRPAKFAQGCVQIEPGDVFVGFTDGVSEAMNPADEEWGEDRMGALIQDALPATPQELIPRIMAAADAFADGAPQHDDMTLVVVRFL